MHAAAILLACASPIQAQTPADKNIHDVNRAALVRSENAADSKDSNHDAAVISARNQSAEANFYRADSGRPYSQLALVMQCNDWRPNLWNNYAAERAAIVAQVSQHVDMQCKCFEGKGNLYSSNCDPSCSGGCGKGACHPGAANIVRNRYKPPMSTLFPAATVSCGSTCGDSSGNQSACGSPNASGSVSLLVPENDETTQLRPASTMRSVAPGITNPPRDRVATPIVNFPRSAENSPNRPMLFESRL